MFALARCTCSATFLRRFSTVPPPPVDNLILAARKLVAVAEDSRGTAIEQAKRSSEVDGLRRALADVEDGEEVSYISHLLSNSSAWGTIPFAWTIDEGKLRLMLQKSPREARSDRLPRSILSIRSKSKQQLTFDTISACRHTLLPIG